LETDLIRCEEEKPVDPGDSSLSEPELDSRSSYSSTEDILHPPGSSHENTSQFSTIFAKMARVVPTVAEYTIRPVVVSTT
jgi:hypothetical protein